MTAGSASSPCSGVPVNGRVTAGGPGRNTCSSGPPGELVAAGDRRGRRQRRWDAVGVCGRGRCHPCDGRHRAGGGAVLEQVPAADRARGWRRGRSGTQSHPRLGPLRGRHRQRLRRAPAAVKSAPCIVSWLLRPAATRFTRSGNRPLGGSGPAAPSGAPRAMDPDRRGWKWSPAGTTVDACRDDPHSACDVGGRKPCC